VTDVENKLNTPKSHLISLELYTKRGNKDEKIINSEDLSEYIESKSRWFSYSFKKPVYISSIEVMSEGFTTFDKFEFELELVDGTIHEEKINVDNNAAKIRPFKLCSVFRFKPDSKYLSNPKLVKIVTHGLTFEEFHDFQNLIKTFDSRLAKLRERESEAETLKESIREIAQNKAVLESDIGKYRAELEQITSNLNNIAAQKELEEKRIKDIQTKRREQDDLLSNTTKSVKDLERQHRELVKELRIFPSELAGFVREGNRNFLTYAIIGFPFLAIISVILSEIFSNSIDLTQLYKKEAEIDVWTIFLTRLPFVIIAVTLIEVSGYVLGRLIFEVIRINRQRLDFAKLSIIAKDVSTSSSFNLDLSEEQVFDFETKLKMELLREHMKNYVGNEFEYKGTGIIAAIKGVADKISRQSD
jgi:hypothetical protein